MKTIKVTLKTNEGLRIEYLDLTSNISDSLFTSAYHQVSSHFSPEEVIGFELIDATSTEATNTMRENWNSLVNTVENLTKDDITLSGALVKVITNKTFDRIDVVPGFLDNSSIPVDSLMLASAFSLSAANLIKERHKKLVIAGCENAEISKEEIKVAKSLFSIANFLNSQGQDTEKYIVTATGKVLEHSSDENEVTTPIIQ